MNLVLPAARARRAMRHPATDRDAADVDPVIQSRDRVRQQRDHALFAAYALEQLRRGQVGFAIVEIDIARLLETGKHRRGNSLGEKNGRLGHELMIFDS